MACSYCAVRDGGLHDPNCPNDPENQGRPVEEVDARELQAMDDQGEDTSDFELMPLGKYWWRYTE